MSGGTASFAAPVSSPASEDVFSCGGRLAVVQRERDAVSVSRIEGREKAENAERAVGTVKTIAKEKSQHCETLIFEDDDVC